MNAAELACWPEADEWGLYKLQKAKAQSELAKARLQGMKVRAAVMMPTTPAKGRFPYPARTCAQWTPHDDWLARR